MRVACIGYRDWALKIYDELGKLNPQTIFLRINSRVDISVDMVLEFQPDFVLFYGWSWMVDEALTKNLHCLMLHPSALPLYRGGSPIQNQILDGINTTKITIFEMNDSVDAGDILAQADLDLTGSIDSIFYQMTKNGITLTQKIFQGDYKRERQIESLATYCKRRVPSDSEITISEMQNMPAKYLFDKIRMLTDPYPNAFFRTRDGKRLLIKDAEVSD